jgi:hypothetical protein
LQQDEKMDRTLAVFGFSQLAANLRDHKCCNCGQILLHDIEYRCMRRNFDLSDQAWCAVCSIRLTTKQKEFVLRERELGVPIPGPPELHVCDPKTLWKTAGICLIPHCYRVFPHPLMTDETRSYHNVHNFQYSLEAEVRAPSIDSFVVHALVTGKGTIPESLRKRLTVMAEPHEEHYLNSIGQSKESIDALIKLPSSAFLPPQSSSSASSSSSSSPITEALAVQSKSSTTIPTPGTNDEKDVEDGNGAIQVRTTAPSALKVNPIAKVPPRQGNDSHPLVSVATVASPSSSTPSGIKPISSISNKLRWEDVRLDANNFQVFPPAPHLEWETCKGCGGLMYPQFAFFKRYGLSIVNRLTICRLCTKDLTPSEIALITSVQRSIPHHKPASTLVIEAVRAHSKQNGTKTNGTDGIANEEDGEEDVPEAGGSNNTNTITAAAATHALRALETSKQVSADARPPPHQGIPIHQTYMEPHRSRFSACGRILQFLISRGREDENEIRNAEMMAPPRRTTPVHATRAIQLASVPDNAALVTKHREFR